MVKFPEKEVADAPFPIKILLNQFILIGTKYFGVHIEHFKIKLLLFKLNIPEKKIAKKNFFESRDT